MLCEPGYFVDQSMNECCCKMILKFIHEHLEDDTIDRIDIPDWVKTNFMVSTSEMIKHKLPRGEQCRHLSHALDVMVARKNLFEQSGFAKGTVWGSLKIYDIIESRK